MKNSHKVRPRIHKNSLQKMRARLESLKRQLLEVESDVEMEALGLLSLETTGEISSIRLHPADLATDGSEQDTDLVIAEKENAQLKDIDDALDRIYREEYGVCENCGGEIQPRRLLVHPYARHCGHCASRIETRKRREREAARRGSRPSWDPESEDGT